MHKWVTTIALAALIAGCGDKAATSDPTPAPRATGLEGYSKGVRDYYVSLAPAPPDDEHAAIEAEYHQPPKPAEAPLGGTITLTGTNIGVRLRATVKRVEPVGDHTAVQLALENTGITVYEGPLREATLTHEDDGWVAVDPRAHAECSNGLDQETVRIDVGETLDGCLLFPQTDGEPTRLQLALEIVPAAAGGIWNLR
ncbi:MAG TPA: hypothetical protein VNS09_13510 [Solirubrobacter sp.]|nr:hypothetical protein [Solirubrobacter sp.]